MRGERGGGHGTGAELEIGLLAFPRVTLLDLVGPLEVFSRLPEARVCVVGQGPGIMVSDSGLAFRPQATLETERTFDLFLVPGGPGQTALMEDARLLDFLRRQARGTRFLASVCTGSLVLAAAGLLAGYRATTHWLGLELLGSLGAVPVAERVVIDRDRLSGAGVSAGLDLALTAAALLSGERAARKIQLLLEYDPTPPFRSGSPAAAAPELVAAVRSEGRELWEERKAQARRLAARLEASHQQAPSRPREVLA